MSRDTSQNCSVSSSSVALRSVLAIGYRRSFDHLARRNSVKNIDGVIAELQQESREGHYRQYQNEGHPFLRGHPSLVVAGGIGLNFSPSARPPLAWPIVDFVNGGLQKALDVFWGGTHRSELFYRLHHNWDHFGCQLQAGCFFPVSFQLVTKIHDVGHKTSYRFAFSPSLDQPADGFGAASWYWLAH